MSLHQIYIRFGFISNDFRVFIKSPMKSKMAYETHQDHKGAFGGAKDGSRDASRSGEEYC